MTGQMSVSAIRSALGWTQADLARELMVSSRTIRRIEKGLVCPRPTTQRDVLNLVHRAKLTVPTIRIRTHRISRERMQRYLGITHGWTHWSRSQRGRFRRWRLYYRRILADAANGRCRIEYRGQVRAKDEQPVAMLLDRAPDIELS